MANANDKSKLNSTEDKKYEYDFDELKLYFREPYMIPMKNGKILEIRQPSIGEIIKAGDREIYAAISPFTANTTSYRVQLWDMGIDWNKYSDYELFTILTPTITDVDFLFRIVEFDEAQIFNPEGLQHPTYKNIDFSKLQPYVISDEENETKEIFLYDPEQEIIIDEETYQHIRAYIRMMFNQHPKEELAKGKLAKQWIINEEKENIKRELEKNNGRKRSVLLPLVSALVNHPGFKYDLEGMKDLGIFAFMDSVSRLQMYEQCTAFMGGMYSGFMDTSKLGNEELNKRINWLQDIY